MTGNVFVNDLKVIVILPKKVGITTKEILLNLSDFFLKGRSISPLSEK